MNTKLKCVLQCEDGEIVFDGTSDELLKSKYAKVLVDRTLVSVTEGKNPVMWIKVNKKCLPA